MPDRAGLRQDALADPDGDAREGTATVLFQAELVLEGVDEDVANLLTQAERCAA
uniref:hypothetical protein n=1 Tax=Peterkaempfera bronchialis TaxID=2126346 RepID=UPI0013B3DCEB